MSSRVESLGDGLTFDVREGAFGSRIADRGDRKEINACRKSVDDGVRIELAQRAYILQVCGRRADIDPEAREADGRAVGIRAGRGPGKNRRTCTAREFTGTGVPVTTTAATAGQHGEEKQEG